MEFIPEWVVGLFVTLFGLAFGSFVTALSWRLPREISVVRHSKEKSDVTESSVRSFCPNCMHRLNVIDLIPVLSWLLFRGKCRYCNIPVSIRYPLIEMGTSILCLLFYYFIPGIKDSWLLLISFMALAVVLMAIIVIDLEHKIIPDILNLSLGVLGVVVIYINMGDTYLSNIVKYTLFNVLLYYGFAVGLKWFFMIVVKRDALGMGDVKFFMAIGFWLSLYQFPIFLFLSGIGGVLVGVIWDKLTGDKIFPFGPALVLAFITCLCLPEDIFLSFL